MIKQVYRTATFASAILGQELDPNPQDCIDGRFSLLSLG